MKKNDLSIMVSEKSQGCEYHYIVTNKCYSYDAFATIKGFKDFLKRYNLKLKFEHEKTEWAREGIKHYSCISEGELHEEVFWAVSEIPEGAIKYKNVSNGSYVDCYYYNKGNDSYNYRPNPNAKEVYKPMTVKEHREYILING